MRYEAIYRNLTFKQAQAMYRVAVNLDDDEPLWGEEGMSWNGLIPDKRGDRPERAIEITPMLGEIHE